MCEHKQLIGQHLIINYLSKWSWRFYLKTYSHQALARMGAGSGLEGLIYNSETPSESGSGITSGKKSNGCMTDSKRCRFHSSYHSVWIGPKRV